jgi:Ca2+-binding EF-hand superfamily protein
MNFKDFGRFIEGPLDLLIADKNAQKLFKLFDKGKNGLIDDIEFDKMIERG